MYGFARRDAVIILANGISLLLGIFYFKWRPLPGGSRQLKNDIVWLCSRNKILASEEQSAFGWRLGEWIQWSLENEISKPER